MDKWKCDDCNSSEFTACLGYGGRLYCTKCHPETDPDYQPERLNEKTEKSDAIV